jgi:tetratricopeptide (TPR) repeat protein
MPSSARSPPPVPMTFAPARAGVVQAALRIAEFDLGPRGGGKARRRLAENPRPPSRSTAMRCGRRDCSRSRGGATATRCRSRPTSRRGHHGIARALAARSRLPEAMDEAQAALRLAPRDLEIHHTVGAIYERMHKYEEAAGAFSNYVNLLPNKDHSEKADWSRSEIKFLRSFGQRVPFETDIEPEDSLYTIDFD